MNFKNHLQALEAAIDFIENGGYGHYNWGFYTKWIGGKPTSAPDQIETDDEFKSSLRQYVQQEKDKCNIRAAQKNKKTINQTKQKV